jgi:hypothetical protein
MSLKLSAVGMQEVSKKWQEKQQIDHWDKHRFCHAASQWVDTKTNWNDAKYNDPFYPIYADNCTPQTLTRFLNGEAINISGFIGFCRAINIEYTQVADVESLLENLTQTVAPIWVGREDIMTKLLEKISSNCRIVVLTGMTGIGKTSLAYKLAENLCIDEYLPEDPIDFDSLIQLENEASFITFAIDLLLRSNEYVTEEQRKNPQLLLKKLIENLANKKRLIWLDSVENLLAGNTTDGSNQFKDSLWTEFFDQILSLENFSSRLIVTSQYKPAIFEKYSEQNKHIIEPVKGLKEPEIIALFQNIFMQKNIDLNLNGEMLAYLEYIGNLYEGHPLALKIIAGEITEKFTGDIESYWQKNKSRLTKVKTMIDQAKDADPKDYYKISLVTQLKEKIIKEEISNTIERLKEDFGIAYYLLIYNSTFSNFEPQAVWSFCLEIEEIEFLIGMTSLSNRYLLEYKNKLPNDLPWVKQHNLVRDIALSYLKKEDN